MTTLVAFLFVTGGLAAQGAQASLPSVVPVTAPNPEQPANATPVATTTKKKAVDAESDVTTDTATTDDDKTPTGTGPVGTWNALTASTMPRTGLTSTPYASFAAPMAAPSLSPMVVGPGNPKYPLPAEPTRSGLFLGTGGLIGGVEAALSPTLTSLLNPSAAYLTSGSMNLATVNVTSTFQTLGIGSLNLVNLTPVGTLINGTLLGQNQHLTLLGGVTSDSYITNVNRGADGFTNNGLGGILLPGGAPAWSSDCASLLGIPLAHCWAVNPAQDNQVIVGDKASANGSQEVVIGRGASHTLPAEDANTVFPGGGRNDPNNPTGVPTSDFASRKGNSVVIGDSASGTANAQTIVGANATSSQVNSVALGNASVADRAGATGYTAFGAPGLQNSVGAVSIGSTGNERQLTHIAAGTDNYDAVNVLQLRGAISSLGALDLLAVTYDADGGGLPTNSVTFTGAGVGTGPVALHNVAAGSLAAGSLDGVNGSQLNNTNQAVATYFGGTTSANATGVFTAPTFSVPNISTTGAVTTGTANDVTTAFGSLGTSLGNVNTRVTNLYESGLKYLQVNSTGAASVATGLDAIALGAGASAPNANSIALGSGSVTSVGAQTGYAAIGLAAPQNSTGEIAVGTRKITGLAAGSAAGDAVNVAQLTGVNDAVDALDRLAVQYDADGTGNPTNRVSLVGTGTGTVSLGNLSAGATTPTSTDAVTGAQLFNANTALTTYLGAGAAFDGAAGTFTPPAFSIGTLGLTGGVSRATHATVGDAFAAVDTSLGNLNIRLNALDANGSAYVAVNSTGTPASAAGTETIAIGGNTTATATNAIAIGNGATAGNANSIALGAGSATTVGAQTGYTAIGLVTPQNSTGEVNVGSRKITGLAAGSAAGDAVNVAQLTGVSDAVGALDRFAVRYDDDGAGNPANSITLAGGTPGTPVALHNVAAGSLAAGSNDAVNGSQLTTANQVLASYFGGTAAVDATGAFTAPTFVVPTIALDGTATTTPYANVTDAFTGLGTSLGNVNTRVDNLSSNAALAVHYDDNGAGAPANHVTLTGATAGTVGIGNLADGAIVASGHDAVSGGQLFTTNDAMVRFFGGGAAFDPLTATFTAPTFALHPVDAGGNVSTANYADVGTALGSIDGSVNTLNTRINSLVAGLSPYVEVNSTAAPAAATGAESIAVGGAANASADNATAVGAQAKATANGSVAIGSGAIADRTGTGTEAFSGNAIAAEGVVSVGSVGAERQITNVAGGTTDTDAVNLRQLRTVSNQVGAIGAAAVQYDDSSHTSVTLNPGATSTVIHNLAGGNVAQGSTDAINGGQLWGWTQDASNAYSNLALYNRIAALQPGGGSSNGALAVNNSNHLPDAVAGGGNSVAVGSGSSSAGSDSTAVGNGAQATAANSVAIGAGSVADRSNTVSVGAPGATRQVTNVAAGTADTDAANVNQVNAVRAAGVHYGTLADGSIDYSNVTLGNASTSAMVHNVSAGKATTDAANVGQLNQVADWSKAYTDQRVGSVNRDIEKVNSRASAGVASAMAMAGLPQASTPGRNMAAVAGGTFRGESSLAVGISTVTDGGDWVYKLSGTANSRGDAGFSVGAGMEW